MPKTKKTRSFKHPQEVPYARGFKPATAKQRCRAVTSGRSEDVSSLSREYQESSHFLPIPRPSSIDDWLAQYNEGGQTYAKFLWENPWLSGRRVKCCQMTFVAAGKTLPERYPKGKIYILPLLDGESGEDSDAPNFSDLADYAARFFELQVEVLPVVELSVNRASREVHWVESSNPDNLQGDQDGGGGGLQGERRGRGSRRSQRSRRHRLEARFHSESGNYQLQGGSVLLRVKQVIPADALCLMALTTSDIYDTPPDLFVAGLAAGNHRVGVFSLKRYAPFLSFSTEHWHQMTSSKKKSAGSKQDAMRTILQRSSKLLVHEISHLLGLDHCIWYSCCMNGSGHLSEDFRQSMHLCPVDLRKLQHLCGFNVVQRYRRLAQFFRTHGLREEEEWVERRLEFITA